LEDLVSAEMAADQVILEQMPRLTLDLAEVDLDRVFLDLDLLEQSGLGTQNKGINND
jgi:hypothetical protein